MNSDNVMFESGKMLIKAIFAEHPYQQFATFVESLRRDGNDSTINAVLEATNTIIEGLDETLLEATPTSFAPEAPASMSLGTDLPKDLGRTSKWDTYKSNYSLFRRLYRELRNDEKFGGLLDKAVETWYDAKESGEIPYNKLASDPRTRKATAIIHTYIIGRLADFALSAYQNPEVAEQATLYTYADIVEKVLPDWNPDDISLPQLISRKGNKLSKKASSSMTSQADAARFGVRGYEGGEDKTWSTPIPRTIAKTRRARMVIAKGLKGDGLILMPYGQWYKLNGDMKAGFDFPDISKITREDYKAGNIDAAIKNPVTYDTPDEIPGNVIKYFLPDSFSGMNRFWEPVSSEQVTGRQMGWKDGGTVTYGSAEEKEEEESSDYMSSIEDPSERSDSFDSETTEDTIFSVISKMSASNRPVERKFGEVLSIVMQGSEDTREEMNKIREAVPETTNPSKLKSDAINAFFARATQMGISREDLIDMKKDLATITPSVWDDSKRSFASPQTKQLAKKKLAKQYGVDKSNRVSADREAARKRASEFEEGGVKSGKFGKVAKPAAFEFDADEEE